VLLRIALVAGRFGEVQKRMQGPLRLDLAQRYEEQPEFGPDAVIAANSHFALALWFLGHHERARATAQASIEAARRSGVSFTLAAALSLGAILEVFHGSAANALALAEEVASLSKDQGFTYWHAMASVVRGQACVLRGETRAGLEQLELARTALQATGTLLFSTHALAFLADAHRRNGTFAAALAAANEGLALAESSLDRTYLPELWRLKGELLLAMAGPPKRGDKSTARRQEAERGFVRALELARECEGKSLELRAATSLARAWLSSGRGAEGYEVLNGVCGWFDSEARGADLDDARVLLEELGNPAQPRRKPAAREHPRARRNVSPPSPKRA
jgi:tetratricopeptide (TPR) repeat protein